MSPRASFSTWQADFVEVEAAREKRWDHSVYKPVNGRDGAGRKSKKAKNGLNMKLFTIGYAQKSAKELFDTLKRNEARKVLEVVHPGGGHAETACPDLF